MANYVKILYGPNDAHFTYAHRPQKLRCLKEVLLNLGFQVDTVLTNHRDECIIEMNCKEIFRCNINNLKFNSSYRRDPVCQRAVKSILDASKRILLANDYLWIQSLVCDIISGDIDSHLGPAFVKSVNIRFGHVCLCSEPSKELFECRLCEDVKSTIETSGSNTETISEQEPVLKQESSLQVIPYEHPKVIRISDYSTDCTCPSDIIEEVE